MKLPGPARIRSDSGQKKCRQVNFPECPERPKVSIVSSQLGTTTDPVEKKHGACANRPRCALLIQPAWMIQAALAKCGSPQHGYCQKIRCLRYCLRQGRMDRLRKMILPAFSMKKDSLCHFAPNRMSTLGKTPMKKADIWRNEHSIGQNIPIIDADIAHRIDKTERPGFCSKSCMRTNNRRPPWQTICCLRAAWPITLWFRWTAARQRDEPITPPGSNCPVSGRVQILANYNRKSNTQRFWQTCLASPTW